MNLSKIPDKKKLLAKRSGSAKAADPPQVRAPILACPAMFVRDVHGYEELERLAAEAGLSPTDFEDDSKWVSMKQFVTFLAGLRKMVADDDAFKAACVYRISDAYGALRFLTLAMAPTGVISLTARTLHLVSRISRCEVMDRKRNSVRLRYTSSVPQEETRLVCLSRQAQSAATPTFFGLPAAHVEEHSCIARGDDACEYTYSFYTRAGWIPALVGLAIGSLITAICLVYGAALTVAWAALPLLGMLAGALIELRATYQANLSFGDEVRKALRDVAAQEAETRREVLALHKRQKNWAKLMEDQVDERTKAVRRVMGQLQTMAEQQVTHMRGFSHDLRNPLAVLSANAQYLRSATRRMTGANEEGMTQQRMKEMLADFDDALDDNEQAITSMERMLSALMDTLVKGKGELVQLDPEEMEIIGMADSLRRRMRALVYGRDIRVSVFMTREAPERLLVDPLIFERVVDNLCTNASKYTERGSIVIELDGNPEYFILQVSDTGRGIPKDMIDKVMMPEGSDVGSRAKNSYGIGLSVTLQLLEQVGGKLEVDSTVGEGTTFWAYFPRIKPKPLPSNVIDIRRAFQK